MVSVSEEELKSKIDSIYYSLTLEKGQKKDIGLLSGKMGEAIFHYHYSQFKNDSSILNSSEEILHKIISEFDKGFNLSTFCTGIYGIAWGFDFLIEEGHISIDSDFFFNEFDNTLSNALHQHFKNQHFDFLYGYIGLGTYLLKRYTNSKTDKSKKLYKEKLNQIIFQLQHDALINGESVYWLSKFDRDKGENAINLGLAHGMAGIINFLSRLVIYPEFSDKVGSLIYKSVQFLLQSKQEGGFSLFPNRMTLVKRTENRNSRLAWCHGDLGIGISLWHAGNMLNDESIITEAIYILTHASKRRNLTKNKVRDAGLCHGAMGIMLIFDQLYKKTKVLSFKEAADFWLSRVMEMAIHKNGHAGFMSKQFKEGKWVWKEETDILDGVSGIGLALISYLSPRPLKWSECLMIT